MVQTLMEETIARPAIIMAEQPEETLNDLNAPDTEQYEIEPSKKKLYLVHLESGRKRLFARERVFATVSVEYGTINIGKHAAIAMGLQKAWYKLAYDSGNKVIAWTVKNRLDKGQMESKAWRYCKGGDKSGQISIMVKRILDTFEGLEKKSYKKLEIKSYKDPKSILDSDKYYYVELSDV